MTRSAVFVAAALLLAAAAPVSLSAQTLQDGLWTGSVSPPGGEGFPVEYEVSNEGGHLSITLVSEMGTFEFENVAYDGKVLTFNWYPGTPVDCELEEIEGGAFEGPCTDEDGDPGILYMEPPANR